MERSKLNLFFTFLVFSIILSIASISVDILFFGDSAKKIALNNATNKIKEREQVFNNFIGESQNTLRSLRELEVFKQYLEDRSQKKIVEDIFFSYAKSQPDFMQLRYIDELGDEQIRIDRYTKSEDPFIIPRSKLQNKKNRYYFYDSKTKPMERVWFSALDLNIEQGKLEIPFRPTLRAIYPIYQDEKFKGILIINYFMERFLEKFLNTPLYDMILCDAKGYPLVHYNRYKNWGYYQKKKYNIKEEFPKQIDNILSLKQYIADNLVSQELNTPLGNRLFLIVQLKKTYLEQQTIESTKQYFVIAIIIFVFSLILSLLVVKKLSNALLNLHQIKKFNENLNSASEIAKIGFWEYQPELDTVSWSNGVYKIFDLKSDPILITKEYFLDALSSDKQEEFIKAFESSIENKEEFFMVHPIKTKKNLKIVEQRAKHYYDDKGNHIKSIGSIYDVTQNYQQQEILGSMNRELEESNNELESSIENLAELNKKMQDEKIRYKSLIDFASDGIHILDKEGNIIECSYSFAFLLGYSIEEVVTLNIKQIDVQFSASELEKALKELEYSPKTFETQHKKKDGTIIDVQINSKSIEIDGVIYSYASSRDITEQKRIQRVIKEQKDEFEAVFNYSKEGIAITDLEANFLQFNEAYRKMLGYKKEELLQMNCKDLTSLEDKQKSDDAFKAVLEYGSIENFEKRCRVKDGRQISVMTTISILPDKERLLIVTKDMTTLKLLEEQSKLASMGEMIGNIAHQWRQPLSLITTSASALEVKSDYQDITKEDIKAFAHTVIDQSNYLSKTIDDFKNFLRGDKNYLQISLKEAILETLRLTDATIKGNFITLIQDIDDDLLFYGNKNELEQAFINILNNAKDALKEIDDSENERYIFISTKKIIDSKIELKILDNAGGIPPNVINRIFEPYFSTKHKSVGTGLGLAMTDKIIRQRHKGEIRVFNKEYEYEGQSYKGACFLITFDTNIKP